MNKERMEEKVAELGLNWNGVELVVPNGENRELAEWVSEITQTSLTMLPKSPEEVLELFREGKSIILLDDEGFPVAHSAITFVYEEAKVVEMGGAVTDPKRRRKGFGTMAAIAITMLAEEKYPGWTKMVLCNAASLPIFLRLGAKIVGFEDLDQIPPEAWEACLICPNHDTAKAEGKICCDTPVIVPW